uniref:Uncharacterized protein n=1 Tax=Tanacetum cinerariifolium TaxID=118510 RepID=A0A6L2K1K4_TANCI|nr:hypothetical protein [Tanacetum cinerariifolium]
MQTEMELVLEQTQQGTSYEVFVSVEGVEELKRKVKIKGDKNEALLALTAETRSIHLLSETLSCCLKDSILQAGNPVKEILLKLNLPDHRILKDGGEEIGVPVRLSTLHMLKSGQAAYSVESFPRSFMEEIYSLVGAR